MKKRESDKNESSKLRKRQRLCMMVRQETREEQTVRELLEQLKEGVHG